MDLSPLFPGSKTALSPSRSLLASTSKDRLVLRTADSLQVLHSIRLQPDSSSPSAAASVAFSPDSRRLLLLTGNGTTTAYECDSAQVLLTLPPALPRACMSAAWLSNDLLGLWCKELSAMSVHTIDSSSGKRGSGPVRLRPKLPHPSGWSRNPRNNLFFALIERTNGQDMLAIYNLSDSICRLARLIRLPTTDAADLSWSPCGRYIAVWESQFEDSLFVVTPDGRPMCHYKVGGSTELGIRCVAWDPLMRFLAIGDYSSQVHILTTLTWTRLLVVSLAPPSSSQRQVVVHHPPSSEWSSLRRNLLPFSTTWTPLSSLLSSASCKKPDPSKAPIRTGIAQMTFSPATGDLLAVRDDSWPQVVFLVSLEEQERGIWTAVQHDQPVKTVSWRPEQPVDAQVLTMVTSAPSVGFWFADGSKGGRAELMQSGDSDFVIRHAEWSSRGDAVLLVDSQKFALGRPVLGPDDP